LDIRQMKVLKAVISTGSTNAAAQMLNVSQPAISKTIKLLESQIQMPLFERSGRTLRPTPQAFAIMPDIERMIASREAINEKIEEIRAGRRGSIKIAAAAMASSGLLPDAIVRYQERYPNVDFSITTATTREVSRMVYQNKVDVGICQRINDYTSLVSQPMKSAFIVCAMLEDHALTKLDVITPEDVMPYPLIVSNFNEPFLGTKIAETFAQRNLYPEKTLSCNISLTSFALVKAGLGVALVDSFTVPLQGVVTRPYIPAIELQVHTIFSGDHSPSPLVKSFCDTVVEVAADRQDHWKPFGGSSFPIVFECEG
jgi:DNA-binding transcriptional LysR family regulator